MDKHIVEQAHCIVPHQYYNSHPSFERGLDFYYSIVNNIALSTLKAEYAVFSPPFTVFPVRTLNLEEATHSIPIHNYVLYGYRLISLLYLVSTFEPVP